MRTAVTLGPDVETTIERAMQERGLTFTAALNEAVRAGAAPRRRRPLPTHDTGDPLVDVTKALRLAGELEHQEGARLARGA